MSTSGAMSGVHFEYQGGKETKVVGGSDSPLPARSPNDNPDDTSSESPPSSKGSPPFKDVPDAKESASLSPEMPEDFDITGSPSLKQAVGAAAKAGDKKQAAPRGWLWVVTQFSLFALILAAPSIPLPEGFSLTLQHSDFLVGLAVTLGAVSVGLLFQSLFDLGRSFSIFPDPVEHSQLKMHGSYSLVRHPMYLAESLLALSIALLSRSNLGLGLVAPLVGVLVGKARVEEKYLHERFRGEYAKYRHQVKRFFFVGY